MNTHFSFRMSACLVKQKTNLCQRFQTQSIDSIFARFLRSHENRSPVRAPWNSHNPPASRTKSNDDSRSLPKSGCAISWQALWWPSEQISWDETVVAWPRHSEERRESRHQVLTLLGASPSLVLSDLVRIWCLGFENGDGDGVLGSLGAGAVL